MTPFTTKTESGNHLEIVLEHIVAITHSKKPNENFYEIYMVGGQLFFIPDADAEAIIEKMKR